MSWLADWADHWCQVLSYYSCWRLSTAEILTWTGVIGSTVTLLAGLIFGLLRKLADRVLEPT